MTILAWVSDQNRLMFRHSSRTRELKGFDVAVAPRLSGRDEGQAHLFAGPVGHRGAGQFGSVVAAQHDRVAALVGDPVQFVDQLVAGDRAGHQPAQTFASVLDDRATAHSPAGCRPARSMTSSRLPCYAPGSVPRRPATPGIPTPFPGIGAVVYSAHSLRAGFVIYAHLRGASDRAIAHQTRHRSLATIGTYIRIDNAWQDNAATELGL
jgi:hypothetical protein